MRELIISPAALREFVRAEPLGVVATVAAEGAPEAALVSFAVTHDGALLFDARDDSRKIENLRSEPRVAIVLGGTGDVTVQVEGRASVLAGADRERAATIFEQWFPGSHALAEGFALVRIEPTWLRSYDTGTTPPTVDEGRPAWA